MKRFVVSMFIVLGSHSQRDLSTTRIIYSAWLISLLLALLSYLWFTNPVIIASIHGKLRKKVRFEGKTNSKLVPNIEKDCVHTQENVTTYLAPQLST